MKKSLLSVIIAAVAAMTGAALSAYAQNTSPFWSLQGNSNAATSSKLGTTNSVPLRLLTNNKVRQYIDATSGNVSIGNASAADPNYRLYVKGTGYGILGSGSTYGIVGSGGSYGVYGSGTTAGVYGSGGTYGTYGDGTSYGFYGHSYKGYGGQAVSDSSDGFDAYSNGGYYGVWAYCPRYIGIYGYGGSYGVYGSSSTHGVYGTGTTTGTYGFSSNGNGIDGESTNGNGGNFNASNGNGLVSTTGNNASYWAGFFTGDVYSSTAFVTSDRNLKKNIQDLGSAMSIINKLQPKFYEFKDDAKYKSLNLPKGTHYGLIAQDLELVLPNLVKATKVNLTANIAPVIITPKMKDGKDENIYQQTASAEKPASMDIKAVNYQELIPIMIKAMQEQNAKIDALTQQVNTLTASRQSGVSNTSDAAVKLSNAYLGQSAPNPTARTASIQYNNLPVSANAQLFVSDANGKMIKQMQLSNNSGTVNVDVSSLSAGTYTYTLLINGKLVETKSMQVAK